MDFRRYSKLTERDFFYPTTLICQCYIKWNICLASHKRLCQLDPKVCRFASCLQVVLEGASVVCVFFYRFSLFLSISIWHGTLFKYTNQLLLQCCLFGHSIWYSWYLGDLFRDQKRIELLVVLDVFKFSLCHIVWPSECSRTNNVCLHLFDVLFIFILSICVLPLASRA